MVHVHRADGITLPELVCTHVLDWWRVDVHCHEIDTGCLQICDLVDVVILSGTAYPGCIVTVSTGQISPDAVS